VLIALLFLIFGWQKLPDYSEVDAEDRLQRLTQPISRAVAGPTRSS
jgi:hypothetical protein